MNTKVSKQARERITATIKLLDRAVELLGDPDDLERHLAGVTSGMVPSPGNAKEGAFRVFDARERLREALTDEAGSNS